MSPIMTRYAPAAALLAVVALAACDKTAVQKIDAPTVPGSQVRFFNFGIGAPALNFYANDTKLTAISSSSCSPTPTDTMQQRICRETGGESSSGVTSGNVGSGGLYTALEPGDYTLKGTIAATTDKDLAVASLPVTLATDKMYSFYVSGFYDGTTKTVESFIVEDPVPAIDWDNAIVRFVNASPNASPMTLTTRDSTTMIETAIGGDVAYKSAGDFVTIPGGLYELYTTVSGSATKVIKRTGVTFSAGHIYTITARGNITVSSGSTAKALDNTANR
jgi:hypothetical protein